MTKPADDFEAARQLIATLEPFDNTDRERIIRWAREKLGMLPSVTAFDVPRIGGASQGVAPASAVPSDIRSFIAAKNPRNDTHLAAVVAYYNRFVAPESERRETITADDLLDACRKADRPRPARSAQTMVNAFAAGLFDKAGRGQYRLNSVGENLVAVGLPGGADEAVATKRSGGVKKGTSRRSQGKTKTGKRRSR